MKSTRIHLAALCLAGVVASASAAPVAYDEATGGDLAASGALKSFALDVGANTVRGNTGYVAFGTTDLDAFAFVVPDGQTLSALTVELANIAGAPGLFAAGWVLYAGPANSQMGDFLEPLTVFSPGSTRSVSVPLSAGSYHLNPSFVSGKSGDGGFADYVFTLTVGDGAAAPTPSAAVPEPGTALLLAVAATTMGALRRRRRRRSTIG